MKNKSNIIDCRFAVLGKIIHTDFFIRQLREHGFPKPLVIVSLDEEYYRDERLLEPYGLYSQIEDLAQEDLCDLYKMKSVNCDEAISLFDQYKSNIGISINCRNIIKKPIIDYFGGKIFNLHDSYLPNERGGALNTWRILNEINEVGNTIHYLEEGIDSGPVVVQKKTKLNKEFSEPVDYLKVEKDNCEIILAEFVRLIMGDNKIPAIEQENDESLYYPRLYTEVNGVINWDWDIESIERFVRGFSAPYPGAFTYYRDKKIHILKCRIDGNVEQSFHPFSNGKIVTVLNNKDIRVIAGGRALIISEIFVGGVRVRPGDHLSIRYTLHSPADGLLRARQHVPTTLSMNKSEEKNITIELKTKNYTLRSMSEKDVTETYLSWLHDPEVTRTLDVDGGSQTLDSLKEYVRGHQSRGNYVFGVYTKEGKQIGTHSFVWSKTNKVAQIGVLIGDKNYWGKGVILETRSRLLNYALELGCKKIEGSCDSINIPAIYNFVKQGWTKEGVRGARRIVDNQPVDLILFRMLDHEWNAKRK